MIRTCRNLTIHKFNEIAIDISNIHLLNEEEESASDGDLLDAWTDIIDEYNDLLNNRKAKIDLKNKAEIYYLEIKLRNYLILLSLLEDSYESNERIETICKGYKIKYKAKSITDGINAIRSKISRKLNEIKPKEDEEKQGSFEDIKASIEESQGIYINRHLVVVTEWISYINRLNKKAKAERGGKVQNRRNKRGN